MAVPVSTGVTWTTVAVALLNLLVGGVLVAIVKARPTLRKIANEREANLLTERAAEMERMSKRIEALEGRLEEERVRHEAERALDRHRINNMDQCLDYLFRSFERFPEKAPEIMSAAKEMRTRHSEAEALEKAAIHAIKIAKSGGEA